VRVGIINARSAPVVVRTGWGGIPILEVGVDQQGDEQGRTASWTATSLSMTRAAPSSTRDGSMGDETYPSEPRHGTLSHSSSATSAVQR